MKTTIAIGVVLAVIRIVMGATSEPEAFQLLQAYKDAAHIFMGGLGVAWWHMRQAWQWKLFWCLNAVEVAVAVLSRV
jgi:hypothetical protein